MRCLFWLAPVAAAGISLHAATPLDIGAEPIRFSSRPGVLAHQAFKIPDTDFSPYDRLCIDVINEGPNDDEVDIQLAQDGDELAKGFYSYGAMRRRHWAKVGKSRWTVDLGHWPKAVKSRKVQVVHFFCARPFGSTMRLEHFRLLKAGEEDEPTRYSDEEEARIAAPAKAATEKAAAARAGAMSSLALACASAGLPTNEMLVATATSMDQVRPLGTEGFSRLRAAKELSLRLARDEYESLQIVATPVRETLRGVRVAVGDLSAENGDAVFAATNISCEVTGYTRTEGIAAYRIGRRATSGAKMMRTSVNPVPGWWADPILPYLHETDVEPGTLQSFWVRVKCPLNQQDGTYRGEIVVEAANAKAVRLPFSVHVNAFAVPRSTPLPLAVTFNPSPSNFAETTADAERNERCKDDPETPWKAWKKHRVEWSDFLAEYYITIDNLYYNRRNLRRDFDLLARQKSRGRDGRINMNFWGGTSDAPKDVKNWEENFIPMLKGFYEEARQFGVADSVYLYGSDETPYEKCGSTAVAAKKLKEIFPDVPLMTTARDPDYGVGSILSDVDIFVPLTRWYNPEKAARARAEGHQVWWYIADGPIEEFANMHLENEPLDARSLMGAQTAKFCPDGFLVWQISKWNSSRPISGGPFTDWDPRGYLAAWNGCGYWTVCGPDGMPVPTVRLENFRDGLEDLAYVKMLEEKLNAVKAEDIPGWTKRARELVSVPSWVCSERDNFSTDPAVIYEWRDAIADLIEAAGQ
ncbi:MAG: DUF4091 domain-containing protein [Kiritimatiellae bacterium]|nr:DUF4091 domain-containing protein [Kiritimatiellia bacterium]